jgi:hypothetical protein
MERKAADRVVGRGFADLCLPNKRHPFGATNEVLVKKGSSLLSRLVSRRVVCAGRAQAPAESTEAGQREEDRDHD